MTELQIPNQTEMLPVLRSFVVESAKLYRFSEKMLEHFRLIAEEAFLHTLKNSFHPGEVSTIRVVTGNDDTYFTVSFFDKGLPFDSSLAREYRPETDINALDTEGMELFLIKQFADKVEWVNHGTEGKEFRLSFELPQRDIITLLKEKKQENPPVVAVRAEDIEIRLFRETDAIKIARTIYRAYGYSYPNEDLYYPERIAALNKSGKLISVVCYDKKQNEVVGHYALERPDLGRVAESGQAVVSPGYRGFHLMNKMRVLLEQKATALQLEGIVSQPVTTHVFSQKVNESFGSLPCGFSFGLVPRKLSFRQISTSLSQRESCLLYFKPRKKRLRRLFLPDRHQAILEKTYAILGIDFEQGKASGMPKAEKNGVLSNYYAGWGFGVITVSHPGQNSFGAVKQAFYNLLFTLKAEVIFLFISLETADISELVEQVEREKFFFCGIAPSLLNGKDAIRFQYLNGTIDSSKINIYGEKAKEIFGYILKEKERVFR